jgi:hypothetical protein
MAKRGVIFKLRKNGEKKTTAPTINRVSGCEILRILSAKISRQFAIIFFCASFYVSCGRLFFCLLDAFFCVVNRSNHFLQVDNNICSETCLKAAESTATVGNWQGKIACVKSWFATDDCDFLSLILICYEFSHLNIETWD